MTYLRLYGEEGGDKNWSYFGSFPSRKEIIKAVKKQFAFDIVVVGGGIHGASFARVAAFNGLRTLLLERDDYGSGTSSRSSKMIHGGLRYLELFDIFQVLEGIKAREDLYLEAPHLVHPQQFIIPIKQGDTLQRLKLGAGLFFYDLLCRVKGRKHSWINNPSLDQSNTLSYPVAGFYSYFDGLTDDVRLVIENIVAARQEGALCLNYAPLVSIKQNTESKVIVGWHDKLGGENYEVHAGVVVNCAGPWVPFVGRLSPSPLIEKIKYSQGIHLIFNKSWNGPAMLLPMGARGRYYFVWPHFAGTLVGTTEREVKFTGEDPTPTKTEIDELLSRLAKDLPNSGLNRQTLHYCFAGVRTLPLRSTIKDTAQISRRHRWSYGNGVLTLIGGKLTTAQYTAYEGLKIVYRLCQLEGRPTRLRRAPFPGASNLKDNSEEFRAAAGAANIDQLIIERTINRLGGRAVHLLENGRNMEVIGGSLLRGEVEMALKVEQAETLEDLMRRRLGLEYMPDHGVNIVDFIADILKEHNGSDDINIQLEGYRKRMQELQQLIR